MKPSVAYFTAGELASIHHINKRTLHYYDEIGAFSPQLKGENGYRYYGFEQSMELEHVLALRELGMSIEEIKTYTGAPGSQAFCSLAAGKMEEIDRTIARLKQLKTAFKEKRDCLLRCDAIYHGKIELVDLPSQYLLMTPLELHFNTYENLAGRSREIMGHLRDAWSLCSYKKNCGSYLSVEKIRRGSWNSSDGIFTQVDARRKSLYKKPAGLFLRGYCVGDWDQIPAVYEKMLQEADRRPLSLGEYAFESGLNEFAITSEEEYITQIEISCIAS